MKKIIPGAIILILAIVMFVASTTIPIKLLGKWSFMDEWKEDIIKDEFNIKLDEIENSEALYDKFDAGIELGYSGKGKSFVNADKLIALMEEQDGSKKNVDDVKKYAEDNVYEFNYKFKKSYLDFGEADRKFSKFLIGRSEKKLKTDIELKGNELTISIKEGKHEATLVRNGFFNIAGILKIGGIVLGVIGAVLVLMGFIGGKKKEHTSKPSAVVITPSTPVDEHKPEPSTAFSTPAAMPKPPSTEGVAPAMPKPPSTEGVAPAMPKPPSTEKVTAETPATPVAEPATPGASRLKGTFKRAEDGSIITPARENGEANMETAGDL